MSETPLIKVTTYTTSTGTVTWNTTSSVVTRGLKPIHF